MDKALGAIKQARHQHQADHQRALRLNLQVARLLQTEVWSYIKEVMELVVNIYEGQRLPVTEDDERRYRNAAIQRKILKMAFAQVETLALKTDKIPYEVADAILRDMQFGQQPEVTSTTVQETL